MDIRRNSGMVNHIYATYNSHPTFSSSQIAGQHNGQSCPTLFLDSSKILPSTIILTITWAFRLYKNTPTYSRSIERTVTFDKDAIAVDILCIRNCHYNYLRAMAGIFRVHCKNCEDAEPEKIQYSPDLAPSDFHLFGPLKRHLGGMTFETEDDLISELRNWFDNLDVDFFRVGINSLLSRWQKCIDLHGDYVEE
ncbi:histone-lysine N-methyltransferase SETMAR [Plakobranchus ocellatus]|uniref:Histone-lysine N-methyltransferase SETMAR n=1 Tax=Plakobranchus ocellatus TaxID=259542 RepID=A0AAV4CLG0_9GAST|nr:histone-lysine N-methyltransferase SETMAR [Plakobranchus ocellatus]